MSSILLLIVCLLLGWILARVAKPPPNLAQGLNWWVLNVAFSALVLELIPRLRFDTHLWFLIAAMWFVFLGAWLFFVLVGRALHWSRVRIGALTLVCGLGNTAFIGLPLIEALRGAQALQLALVADQAGTFIALGVGGTVVAAIYSGAHVNTGEIVKKVLLFPPFMAFCAGIFVGLLGGWPSEFEPILTRIGATLVPIALFTVGLQFRLDFSSGQASAITLGLAWKILLAPTSVYLAATAFGVSGMVLTISVLQAAMAPMISGAILAEQNNLEPQLVNTVLGIGILVAFITVPIANTLL